MNILVITIGNSEIQISANPGNGFAIERNFLKKQGLPDVGLKENRGYTDFLVLAQPRRDGEIILKNYLAFREIIQFPMIAPLLKYFRENNMDFQEVWWVYTDQQNEREHFKATDTLYYKSILQNYFEETYKDLVYHDYAITDHVKDIDQQYKNFYQKALAISNRRSEIDKIFLLPQGGIDQINQALTLQLIQIFKDKVCIYQNAEMSAHPVQLQFPHLFLNDLTKQNVIKHIKDYDFDKAEDLILDDIELKRLAGYAASRLNLLYEAIDDNKVTEEYKIGWEKLTQIEQQRIKLQDLVYAFKIQMKQGKYNDALIKLFTISESMYKQQIEEHSGGNIGNYFNNTFTTSDRNESWEMFITEKLNPEYVLMLKKKKIHLNNPNSMTYCYLYRWLLKDNKIKSQSNEQQIKQFNSVIFDLRDKRNNIAHSLDSITIEQINAILEKRNISLEELYKFIDDIVFTKGFGRYEIIRSEILTHYGESV